MKSRHRRFLLLAFSWGNCLSGWAQLPAEGGESMAGSSGVALRQRGWEITPSIALDLTQTDNVALQAADKKSDLIVRTSPGVKLQGQSARARAYVDFKLQQVDYMQTEGRDRLQRALNGMGNVELLEDRLFLDLSARISRQAISAFGAPASGVDSVNANVVESSMYQISPYIKGRLFGAADYMLRFDNTEYSAKNGPLRDTTIQSVQGGLSGATPLSRLNWSVDANAQQSRYSTGAKNETDALRASLYYTADPQLRFNVVGGRESNDYIDFRQETSSITGWGVEWAPTERTRLTWNQEKRYFGDGHRFSFTHRTPFTAWRISDSRDVMIRAPQTMTFAMGTYFDLLNEQYRSTIPDDAARARFVEALLQAANISPDAQVIGGFMSSRASINRTKEASFTWTGARNVVTFSAQSQDRTALGNGVGIVPDDFDVSSTIRQRGVNLNWAHKLTPMAALTLMAAKSRTSGNGANLETDREMYTVTLSNKLGAYTSGSIGVRRTEVSGFVEYVENAILGSLLMVF